MLDLPVLVRSIDRVMVLDLLNNIGTPGGHDLEVTRAAGTESLDDYFQKGSLLGQKAALNLWYVDTRPNLQTLFTSI